MKLKSLKPAVSRTWLIAIAGVMWSLVGLMLCRLAYHWLVLIQWKRVALLELLGIALALMAHQFCFSRIAQKNITRLFLLTEKTCVFAFQKWKSYFLIALMVTLGIVLRNLEIPKPDLAVLYTAIGGALFLGSLQYYRCLWRIVTKRGAYLPVGKITE